MKQLDLKKIIEKHYPNFYKLSAWRQKLYLLIFSKIIYLKDINLVLEKYGDSKGIDFIDNLFDHLNFSFSFSNKDIKKIPSEGKIIIVANHPIGSLDGLALLKLVSEIREDVKIIANDILYEITNLRSHFIPFNLESRKIQRQNISEIDKSLENEEAVIIFPAAEVSRLKLKGIK
jgi:hypothetical protein